MAEVSLVLAQLLVFLLIVSKTSASAPADHYSRSQDETFESEDSNSTAITPYSPNSNLDGFNSQFMTVDLDLEGFLKPSITGNTTVSTSRSFLFDVSLHSPQSWFEDPSSWTITTFLAIWGFVSIVIGVISLCYYLGLLHNRRKRSKRPKICEKRLPNFMDFSNIQVATNRFHPSNVIFDADPSFILYEGHLPYHGRCTIKRFMKDKSCPKEFRLWQLGITHKNMVAVRGWSKAKDEFVLVYDYMPQTLHELLANDDCNIKRFHTWDVRVSMIQSVAAALEYLHDNQILYNNLCSCKIFLDWNLKVKLGDLGNSVLLTKSSSPSTLKSDVYSFGVILFEVLTGRGHFHNNPSKTIDVISDLWGRNILLEALDHRLAGNYPSDKMERLLKVGLWCVHPNPDERPTISSIFQMIVGSRYISDPPRGKRLSDILVEPEPLQIQVEPNLIKPKHIEPDYEVLEILNTDPDMREFLDTFPRPSTTFLA